MTKPAKSTIRSFLIVLLLLLVAYLCRLRAVPEEYARGAGVVRALICSVLFVRITHILGITGAKITNNGRPPAGPITEGGGLSSLRARVEKAGGAVWIRWAPTFELTVSVPEQEEGL